VSLIGRNQELVREVAVEVESGVGGKVMERKEDLGVGEEEESRS
jgi:hypothetical protein